MRTMCITTAALLLLATACATEAEVAENVSDLATATAGATPDANIQAETAYSAELSGDAEVPGPGSAEGRGEASIDVSAEDQVCFQLAVEGVEAATAAHIHEGAEGESGPPVVDLVAPSEGSSSGCTDADTELIRSIRDEPENFYVNVHNEEFPDGAVRGQLGPPEP